jgi:4-aminobutyrate aminotransferase-like enzyme
VGLAVLDVVRNEALQLHAHRLGQHFLTELKNLKKQYSVIGDVRGLGLFLGIELVDNPDTLKPAPDLAKYIQNTLLKQGILMSIDGPLHNVLKIKPPMVISFADIERVIFALKTCFQDATKS